MKKTVWTRHPYLFSILLALTCLLFVGFGSAISQILSLEDDIAYWVMGSGCTISAIVGVIIMKCSCFSFREYGFCKMEQGSLQKVWAFIPLLLVEVTSIAICGFSFTKSIVPLIFFTLAVGFNEEIFFRGLIYRYISQKGIIKGVIISSTIFAVVHAGNLLGGADLFYTILQVIFAFLVGVVLAEIAAVTKSLWAPIIWHALHDFISIQGGSGIDTKAMIAIIIQVVVLLVYLAVLWRKATKQENVVEG